MLTPAPETAVPGQGYGIAGQQRAAQRAIPMANGPTMPANQPPAAQQPPNNDLMSQLQSFNGPGESLSLTRPSERPNEPVTHGLPTGPGAGPEALQGVGAAAREGVIQQGTLRNLLTNLAAQPGATTAIQDLAARAQGGVA